MFPASVRVSETIGLQASEHKVAKQEQWRESKIRRGSDDKTTIDMIRTTTDGTGMFGWRVK